MLQQLSIRNYALIKELEINPSSGLNMITGETGAGKSIMLGAVGLLLGNRADTKVLFNQDDKCVIEGTFRIAEYELTELFQEEDLDYEDTCIIRREIASNGKSRAFINDTPVTLEVLRKIGTRLMDVHSQHETLLLGDQDFQMMVLDAYAGNLQELKKYKIQYKKYRKSERELKALKDEAEASAKQLDYNSFLLTELLEINPVAGEQEKLEEQLKTLENSEDISSRLSLIQQCLSEGEQSVVSLLTIAEKNFSQLSKYTNRFNSLKERLNSTLLEIKDIASEVEAEGGSVEFSPEEMQKIQERLSRLYTLEKKHQVSSIDALLEIQSSLEEIVNRSKNFNENLEAANKQLEQDKKELLKIASKMSEVRKKHRDKLSQELQQLLKEVGIKEAVLTIDQQESEPGVNGTDLINFLFSANKGVAPQPLKNAASGGEFSRLMLCLKYILAEKTSLPTIIFDEIDTGISGEVAIKVGKMMKQMGAGHQVLVITHLPQIAAMGETHYYVYKDSASDKTVSKMKKLSNEERVKEIAQMIGGEKPSETALKNAKELLSL